MKYFDFISDDPQEECLKCNRYFLASSNLLIHGYCGNCYLSNQGIPLIVPKTHMEISSDDISIAGSENEAEEKLDTDTSNSQQTNDIWSPNSPSEEHLSDSPVPNQASTSDDGMTETTWWKHTWWSIKCSKCEGRSGKRLRTTWSMRRHMLKSHVKRIKKNFSGSG